MARRVDQRADVVCDPRGRPQTLAWEGRVHAVREEIDSWDEAGAWWEGEGLRRFYLLSTVTSLQCEVCFEPEANRWTLCRIWD